MKILINSNNSESQSPIVEIDLKTCHYPYAIKNAFKLALELDGYTKETILEVFGEYHVKTCCGEPEQDLIIKNNQQMIQIHENSHFWTDTDMLINWVANVATTMEKDQILAYLVVGLNNSKNNGYFIQKGCQDPIVESVREKFKERSNVGVAKYKTTLSDNNTDDFFNHLQEELMDACNYLEKIKSIRKNESS